MSATFQKIEPVSKKAGARRGASKAAAAAETQVGAA